jgi:hypothetical protein
MAPPFGVTRGRPMGTGGYIRRASSRHASRYGSALTLTKSISSSDLNAVRTSAVSLFKANLFVNKRKVTPERRVAVVSDPPMTRIPLFAWRLSSVSPYCPLWLESQPHITVEGPATHPLLFLLQQPLYQVRPLLPPLHPPPQLCLGHLHMLHPLLHQLLRRQRQQ